MKVPAAQNEVKRLDVEVKENKGSGYSITKFLEKLFLIKRIKQEKSKS